VILAECDFPGVQGTSLVSLPVTGNAAVRSARVLSTGMGWPSFSSSPWIRWYPRLWFSVATSSRSTSSSASLDAAERLRSTSRLQSR
jgi:hypothetical protein